MEIISYEQLKKEFPGYSDVVYIELGTSLKMLSDVILNIGTIEKGNLIENMPHFLMDIMKAVVSYSKRPEFYEKLLNKGVEDARGNEDKGNAYK